MSIESPTEHFEHAEHAEHVARSGDQFLMTVSMSIAVLAVVAATIGSFESIETAATISSKNEAVFFQNKETDQWNFFQAKSIKKNMYDIAASNNPGKADEYAQESKRQESESREIQEKAKELEQDKNEKLEEADKHEQRHHILTVGVTLVHIAIAITTIAIVVRRRWPWYAGLALGGLGIVASVWAYIGVSITAAGGGH